VANVADDLGSPSTETTSGTQPVSTPASVLVLPSGIPLEAQWGETVMSAASRAGLTWPTVCHGHARCTACSTVVISGAEQLSPMEQLERAALDRVPALRHQPERVVRLACQARVLGDVVLLKYGVT
jgi:2Fe-2S ferredoxin